MLSGYAPYIIGVVLIVIYVVKVLGKLNQDHWMGRPPRDSGYGLQDED